MFTVGSNGNYNINATTTINSNHGYLTLHDEEGDAKTIIYVNEDGQGGLETLGSNGNLNIDLSDLASNPNHGFLSVRDAEGNAKTQMYVNDEGQGRILTRGTNGNLNINMSNLSSNPNHGFLSVRDATGDEKAEMYVNDDGQGRILTRGANGNVNINMSNLSSNPNHGFISVRDAAGDSKVRIYVNSQGRGIISADDIQSVVDDPSKSGEPMVYSMILGPESAAFLRGTGTMIDGVASIDFPSHFSNLISKSNITVQITPLSADSKGIAVIKKGVDGFRVKELLNGTGNYAFDWEVKGTKRINYKSSISAAYDDNDNDQSDSNSREASDKIQVEEIESVPKSQIPSAQRPSKPKTKPKDKRN